MRNKRIIISLIVVVAGLMLGVIFSQNLANKTEKGIDSFPITQSNVSISTNPEPTVNYNPDIGAGSSIKPTSIKVVDKNKDTTKNLDGIDIARLKVYYKNNTGKDLNDVTIWLEKLDETALGFSNTNSTKIVTEATRKEGRRVYSVKSVKSGEGWEGEIIIYAKKPGTYTLKAEIRSGEGAAQTPPVVLTATN